MQGTVNIPGLDALSIAEFARGGEMALLALEGEGSQGRQPSKPRRRIGGEGKHPLGGRNDHPLPIGTLLDERKCTGARLVTVGWGGGLGCNLSLIHISEPTRL